VLQIATLHPPPTTTGSDPSTIVSHVDETVDTCRLWLNQRCSAVATDAAAAAARQMTWSIANNLTRAINNGTSFLK